MIDWIEEKNPYLAFKLLTVDRDKSYLFPKININVEDGVEVIYIDGVVRCLDSLSNFLSQGGEIVFVEGNVEKIAAFLNVQNCSNIKINIILPEDSQYRKIAFEKLFLKNQFVGELHNLKLWLDCAHMIVSDYSDFGKNILENVLSNLLHSDRIVDGRQFMNLYRGKPAIVCGSGKSLECSIDKLQFIKNKAIIIAAGSSMLKLIKSGIKPHFGAFIDPFSINKDYITIKDELSFPIFMQNRMSKEMFLLHSGEKIWMGLNEGIGIENWIYDEIKIDYWEFDSGWNCGNFSLNVAKFLGCDPIYIVGMDGGDRRDLFYGKMWNDNFIKDNRDKTFIEGLNLDVDICHDIMIQNKFNYNSVDKLKLQNVILYIYDKKRKNELDNFLYSLENGIESEAFRNNRILLESELKYGPLYEYLLKPLWAMFQCIFLRQVGNDEISYLISEFLFFKNVLTSFDSETFLIKNELSQSFFFLGKREGEVKKYYKSGNLYSVENYLNGKSNGKWLVFYENGDIKSCVNYCNGRLHGDFHLYSKSCKKRSGEYDNGKMIGFHRLWSDNGELIVESEYKDGNRIGIFKQFDECGNLVEEIEYLQDGNFNKKCYDKNGEILYECLFNGDNFSERKFHEKKIVNFRKGIWSGGKIVWC